MKGNINMKKSRIRNFKIVVDENCDLSNKYQKNHKVEKVSPKSEGMVVDKEAYLDMFNGEEEYVFVFTMSGKESGNYDMAMRARHDYNTSCKKAGIVPKKIFVCDSKTTAGGEMHLVMRTLELIKEGFGFSQICVRLMCYRNQIKTYIMPGSSLENEGIPSTGGLLSLVDGEMMNLGKSSSEKIESLIDMIEEDIEAEAKKTIIISHCNAEDKVKELKKLMKKQLKPSKIVVMETLKGGHKLIQDGGIVIAM